jgi:hypothetical protein
MDTLYMNDQESVLLVVVVVVWVMQYLHSLTDRLVD